MDKFILKIIKITQTRNSKQFNKKILTQKLGGEVSNQGKTI